MNTKLLLQTIKKGARTAEAIGSIAAGVPLDWTRAARRRVLYPTMPIPEDRRSTKNALARQEKHRISSLLSKLKKEGLIDGRKGSRTKEWFLTERGRKRLEELSSIFLLPRFRYKKEKDDGLNLVIFDIPETHKRKREWLRGSLIALDFKLLQKSVWMGNNKVTEEFIQDIRTLGLLDFIHIFRVKKTGTLR
mgnify:CR=1 FL=1